MTRVARPIRFEAPMTPMLLGFMSGVRSTASLRDEVA